MTPITADDVEALKWDFNAILTTKAKIKAGVLIGQFNYFNGDKLVTTSKDLDETAVLEAGETFKANGYVKLVSEDLFELEMKTGEEDFARLLESCETHKADYEAALTRLDVTSVAAARTRKG